MTTQTEARAPFTQVSVQLPAPDAPPPVTSVSWVATRFSAGGLETGVYTFADDCSCRTLATSNSLAAPDVPAWVPRPPSGWLASLKMTAEPDLECQGQNGLCGNTETTVMVGGVPLCGPCSFELEHNAAEHATAEPEPSVVDLVAALRASVEAAKVRRAKAEADGTNRDFGGVW